MSGARDSPIRRLEWRSQAPTPRGTDAPVRGLPWYKSTLTISAQVDRDSGSVTVVPSAGLMRVNDGVWVTLPSQSKEAYAKLTAGLTPRPARMLPSVGAETGAAGRPRRRGLRPERDLALASDGSNGSDRRRWAAAALSASWPGRLLLVEMATAARRRRPAAPEAPG